MSGREQWMTAVEVAEAAGVDRQMVYKAVDTGGLPAYKIGRVFRFKRAEVEAWIERRRQVGQ